MRVTKGEGANISRFLFLPLPLPFRSFFVSLWVSSRGILVVFLKRRGCPMCTFGVLGLSCETSAAPKPLGIHSTTKRAHVRVPEFKNTTEIQRKDSRKERRKNENCCGRRKKERNFGRSGVGGGLAREASKGSGPRGNRKQPTPTTTNTQHQHPKPTHLKNGLAKNNWIWPQLVLATIGFGQNLDGQKMDWPKNGLAKSGLFRRIGECQTRGCQGCSCSDRHDEGGGVAEVAGSGQPVAQRLVDSPPRRQECSERALPL